MLPADALDLTLACWPGIAAAHTGRDLLTGAELADAIRPLLHREPVAPPASHPVPDEGRRSLAQVLIPRSLARLDALCATVRAQVPPAVRLLHLADLLRHDALPEIEAAILMTALATDPEAVEAMLDDAPILPGTVARWREQTGCRTDAELWHTAAQARQTAQDAAQRRRQAERRARAQAPAEAIPDAALTLIDAVPVQRAAEAIGMMQRHGRWGPCPACNREQASTTDKRPPVRIGAAQWLCGACNIGGGTVRLLCVHATGNPRPTTRDDVRATWAAARSAGLV
jgi:hypothetical protein